ncbi:hypothetical protein BCR36DRAFT_51281 [Piromyces finnis]|uniref:RGS domain-containing protein n=1 Tax=Piromyces finnis TaxID=1754191 RepID=A0A1Y1VMH1_9FUNG|nr:hypothetical protein BCR36DRAFT_51281 [Piromyces finnis]|eukprot:ORX60116.1 hypothetical protein BCR36DRAFT_51281 [Piromyces finnis]
MNEDKVNYDFVQNVNDKLNNEIGRKNIVITETMPYYNKTYENIILPCVWSILAILMIGMISIYINYKNRPQYQYRSVKLTLLYCFSSTAYVLLIIAARMYKFSCIVKLWITDICIVLSLFSIMSRGVRIIYLWKLNTYKLSNSKKRKITLHSTYEPEANTYFKAVYRLINEEIAKRMIILPIIIDFMVTAFIHYLVKDKCDNNPIVFVPIMVFVFLFTISFPFFMYQLHRVHEYNRITSEVEYLITSLIWWIILPLYIVTEYVPKYKKNEIIHYYTNDGVFFFVLQEFLVFIIMTIIPLYEMLIDKKKYKNIKEEEMSMEYFYKLINDPIIIEELKEVAISEFSVENVLFWESYRDLMKIAKHPKSNAIKKMLYTGLNKLNKELNGKSSKSNLINKMINHDQLSNQEVSNVIYEYEKNNSHKYYNQKSNKKTREMNTNNNFYNSSNEYNYYSSSSNGSTSNLLANIQISESSPCNSYNCSPTSSINNSYIYIDNNSQDSFDNNGYNYNLYQHQRRRSIKQFNIDIEAKTNSTENFNDNTSSSEISADTPVPLKLYNYYQNFYYTFIDVNSTAAVNINCNVRNAIEENIKNPKIGIFDEAKEEVLLLMFRNLNSKLILQLKQKQMLN